MLALVVGTVLLDKVLVFLAGCLRLGSVLTYWFTPRERACFLEGACVSCWVLALVVGFAFLVYTS